MVRSEYQIVTHPRCVIDYSQGNLTELIRDGYGFYGQEALIDQVRYEYGNADKVYFALNKNGSEIGSLSIGLRPNKENDPFWTTLQTQVHKSLDMNVLACYIYGIVVRPEVRREGIASRLLSRMIEDLSPQIIFGQTKVPEAVFLRAKVARLYGYRTFFGFREVTPNFDYK